MKRQHLVIAGLGLAALVAGCAPQKKILITSYPPGATVYIDGEKRGQTDSSFLLTFGPKLTRKVRIEKDGFQPWGEVFHIHDGDEIYAVLQQAPSGRELEQAIRRLESRVEVLPSRVDGESEGGSRR